MWGGGVAVAKLSLLSMHPQGIIVFFQLSVEFSTENSNCEGYMQENRVWSSVCGRLL